MPSMSIFEKTFSGTLEYEFQLEREILCTTKTQSPVQSTNPFFQ